MKQYFTWSSKNISIASIQSFPFSKNNVFGGNGKALNATVNSVVSVK